MKPTVVVLDGPDGVGKTSVRMLFRSDYFVIERFTPSLYAYTAFFRRQLNMDYVWDIEKGFQTAFQVAPVMLFCDYQELFKRYMAGIHKYKYSVEDLANIQDLMMEFVNKHSTFTWFKVDTTTKPPEQIYEEIRRKFEI
jgi:thymidylate kinase